jgi:hypothetical protein
MAVEAAVNADALKSRESHVYVDPTPTRDGVLLINITEDMASWTIVLTPDNAAKLGQMLVSVANRMQ